MCTPCYFLSVVDFYTGQPHKVIKTDLNLRWVCFKSKKIDKMTQVDNMEAQKRVLLERKQFLG